MLVIARSILLLIYVFSAVAFSGTFAATVKLIKLNAGASTVQLPVVHATPKHCELLLFAKKASAFQSHLFCLFNVF